MKKHFIWMGTLGLAVVGLLLPQFADASSSTIDNIKSPAVSEEHKAVGNGFRHQMMDKEEMQSLMDKGYSKKEVFQAAHLASVSEKSIEDVLAYYKKSNSWTATAEHFGVSHDQLANMKLKNGMHHLKKIDRDKFDELIDQGYSKKDVFQAAQVASLSNESIDDVLAYYKKSKSWSATAEHFGVKEQFQKHQQKWEARKKQFEAHKDEILNYLADYSNHDVNQLRGYLDEGVRLPHLMKSIIVSKLSKTDLKVVIDYKKKSRSPQDMTEHFNVKEEDFHAEMKKMHTDIKALMKK